MEKNKTIKAGIGYTVGNILLRGLSFITIPIFTRLMTPDSFGKYNVFVAYASILSIIIGCAIHTSLKNAYYEFKDKFNEYVSSIIGIVISAALILLCVLLCCYNIVVKFIGFNFIIIVALIAQSFANSILTIYNSYLSIFYDYKKYLILSGITAISSIVFSIVFIECFFVKESYVGRILGTSLPVFLASIMVCWIFNKQAQVSYSEKFWKFGLKYSLPIIPHGLSQILLANFNRIIIQKYVSDTAAGLFSFSVIFNTIYMVIAGSLDNVYGPWFYEKMSTKNYIMIRKKANLYIIGMTIFLIIMMLLNPCITKNIAPSSYQNSIKTTNPLLISAFFMYLYLFPAQVEYYLKKTNMISIGTMLAAIVNVLLSIYFVPRYGFISAAYVNLFSYFLYFIFHFIMARKFLGFWLYDVKIFILMISIVLSLGFFMS